MEYPVNYPFVSIIVVSKNEEAHIERCLKSLTEIEYPVDKYEIIVIDGDSTDHTVDIAKKFPVTVYTDTIGLAHSRNMGINKAEGDLVAFTDADCAVQKDWLDVLVRNLLDAPDMFVASGGPNLIFEDDSYFAKIVGYLQETFLGSGGSPQSYRIRQKKIVRTIPNCNILYRKKILDEEGGFNDALHMSEDAELNYRLSQKGYKFIYIPNAVVWHRRPDTLPKYLKKMYLYGKGMGILARMRSIIRWYSPLPTIAILGLLVAYPLSRVIPSILIMYQLGMLTYLLLVLLTTVEILYRYKEVRSVYALGILPLQHISYGIGFLIGIFRGK